LQEVIATWFRILIPLYPPPKKVLASCSLLFCGFLYRDVINVFWAAILIDLLASWGIHLAMSSHLWVDHFQSLVLKLGNFCKLVFYLG